MILDVLSTPATQGELSVVYLLLLGILFVLYLINNKLEKVIDRVEKIEFFEK